jgi:hypothetical protein
MMSRDEFLDSVNQIIITNERSGAGLKASVLGVLILKSLRVHWNDFGFHTLKTVLQELEGRSQVRIGYDEKNVYTVWPLVTATAPISLVHTVQSLPSQPTNDRLKKGVWIAFVNALPQGRRFIHRATGATRMGLFEVPHPESEWTEIHRIGDDVQRTWAREFLDNKLLGNNLLLREALNDGPWFMTFRDRLRAMDPQLLSQWNSRRSARVKTYVDEWCAKKGLDPQLMREKNEAVGQLGEQPEKGVSTESAREHILAALARMPTPELLQIPIAGKYFYPEELNQRPMM